MTSRARSSVLMLPNDPGTLAAAKKHSWLSAVTRRTGLVALAVVSASCLPASLCFAQCTPQWLASTDQLNWVNSSASVSVQALATLPGGDVMVGGSFDYVGFSLRVDRIARYSPSSNTWSRCGSFPSSYGIQGVNAGVGAMAVTPGGQVIVGGTFTTAGGVSVSNIARYNPSTNTWTALGAGTNGAVNALAVLPNGDVIAGGNFTSAGGIQASYVARFNAVSGLWFPMGTGMDPNGYVQALVTLPDGDIIAGGLFSTAGDVDASRIARYHLATDTWSPLGAGLTGSLFTSVSALALAPDGTVIVGGSFTSAGSVSARCVARYNSSTEEWSRLGTGVTSSAFPFVRSATVLPDGKVVVGGLFTTAGGVAVSNIARFDPSTNTWSALGSGANNSVSALATLPTGDTLAGGTFTTAGGNLWGNYFARYTLGGTAPTISAHPQAAGSCPHSTASMSVMPSGSGPFSFQWRKGTVAINPVANPSALTGTLVLTNLQASDGGEYDCVVTNSCGSATSDAAVLTIGCSNRADVAGLGGVSGCDGQVSADDIVYFLVQFFSANTAVADIAALGGGGVPDGQITADDLVAFLTSFFAGCP